MEKLKDGSWLLTNAEFDHIGSKLLGQQALLDGLVKESAYGAACAIVLDRVVEMIIDEEDRDTILHHVLTEIESLDPETGLPYSADGIEKKLAEWSR